MPKEFTEKDLKPGDCILYKPKGLFGWIIAIKTWHMVGHVEVYIGNGLSIAARSEGVDYFPLRLDNIHSVQRPRSEYGFRILKAIAWFDTIKGQGYDWLGLLRFAWRAPVSAVNDKNKQFCSEVSTRFYRKGDLPIFRDEDADAIAPFQFLTEYHFTQVNK